MATPLRLSEVECPRCHGAKWILDNDYHGADLVGGVERGYPERSYACDGCGWSGAGWSVRQQAPPAFLLQPHELYPMTRAEFDRWVAILRANFPDHRSLAELGKSFFPCTPEDAAAARAARERARPVDKLRDQDGAGTNNPSMRHATDRVGIMRPGDTLSFFRRDGGTLELQRGEAAAGSFSCRCADERGRVLADAADLDPQTVLSAIDCYLAGDVSGCVARLQGRP
jgi:hypothetical protein